MRAIVGRILSRVKPPVLRANDPQTPFKTRGRHPLLEETRFLLLTRRGPIEIVVRPTYVFAAAFVGLVGSAVIAATTLFIGYKSVEVVSNDTITTAEASIPLEDPIDGSEDFMPMVNANEGFDDDGTGRFDRGCRIVCGVGYGDHGSGSFAGASASRAMSICFASCRRSGRMPTPLTDDRVVILPAPASRSASATSSA